jgi:DNA-binding XRE family transcriptional regulator
MSWSKSHADSERLAAEAQLAARRGDSELARKLYAKAARAEVEAIAKIDKSKVRTLGVTVVSAAALWYKAGEFAEAESIAYQWLRSRQLPPFASDQLRKTLEEVWNREGFKARGIETDLRVEEKRDEICAADIATVLKEEILRLARKEVRRQTNVLRKASGQYRKDIAEMKRRVADLQRKVVPLERQVLKNAPVQTAETDADHVRFTAKGLRSQRKRLGLSAANYGKLIGVTGQTIYRWEGETSRPRKQQVARIAALRHMAKRKPLARLKQLLRRNRKKSK